MEKSEIWNCIQHYYISSSNALHIPLRVLFICVCGNKVILSHLTMMKVIQTMTFKHASRSGFLQIPFPNHYLVEM